MSSIVPTPNPASQDNQNDRAITVTARAPTQIPDSFEDPDLSLEDDNEHTEPLTASIPWQLVHVDVRYQLLYANDSKQMLVLSNLDLYSVDHKLCSTAINQSLECSCVSSNIVLHELRKHELP